MTPSEQELVMQALEASMAAAMPQRHVQRKLVDPAKEKLDRLTAGVICVVSAGGGNFANWSGREGELGTMNVAVVGFLQVGAKTSTEAVEQAELAMLGDLLDWCQQQHADPIGSVTPGDYRQSQQLSHPMGWLALDLKVGAV